MGRKYVDLTGQNINGVFVKGLVEEIGKAGKHKHWYCICPVCNKEFIVASHHLTDKVKPIAMCVDCQRKQYKDLIGQRFGKLTVLAKDENTKNKRIKYICQCDCGSIVSVQSNHLTSGEIISCGCAMSYGEEYIGNYLSSHNIDFEKQKVFDDCKNKRKLRFDFYIPSINTIIEYQGIQHYEPVKFFGGETRFFDTLHRDKIKEEYCNENNIKLVTIPYYKDIDSVMSSIMPNEDIVCPYGNIAG